MDQTNRQYNGAPSEDFGNSKENTISPVLAWIGIGVGAAGILAPDRFARLIGIRDSDASLAALRAVGVLEIAAGIGVLAMSGNKKFASPGKRADVSKSVFINRPPSEVYQYWRQFQNLPTFM